ncbi:hypothetical protein FPV04_03950, partial [Salmonella enterica]|nr:hypothetical protein [Salmonella enterica]
LGDIISKNKKTYGSYTWSSRADIFHSFVASTTIETGKTSAKVKASLEASGKKFSHLRLTI